MFRRFPPPLQDTRRDIPTLTDPMAEVERILHAHTESNSFPHAFPPNILAVQSGLDCHVL